MTDDLDVLVEPSRENASSAVAFLGLEQMIRTKRAAGRTKDLLDLELLREAGVLDDE